MRLHAQLGRPGLASDDRPGRLRNRIDAFEVTVVHSPWSGHDVDPSVLLALSATVRGHEVLR